MIFLEVERHRSPCTAVYGGRRRLGRADELVASLRHPVERDELALRAERRGGAGGQRTAFPWRALAVCLRCSRGTKAAGAREHGRGARCGTGQELRRKLLVHLGAGRMAAHRQHQGEKGCLHHRCQGFSQSLGPCLKCTLSGCCVGLRVWRCAASSQSVKSA